MLCCGHGPSPLPTLTALRGRTIDYMEFLRLMAAVKDSGAWRGHTV